LRLNITDTYPGKRKGAGGLLMQSMTLQREAAGMKKGNKGQVKNNGESNSRGKRA